MARDAFRASGSFILESRPPPVFSPCAIEAMSNETQKNFGVLGAQLECAAEEAIRIEQEWPVLGAWGSGFRTLLVAMTTLLTWVIFLLRKQFCARRPVAEAYIGGGGAAFRRSALTEVFRSVLC
jgi:hypothetical protein